MSKQVKSNGILHPLDKNAQPQKKEVDEPTIPEDLETADIGDHLQSIITPVICLDDKQNNLVHTDGQNLNVDIHNNQEFADGQEQENSADETDVVEADEGTILNDSSTSDHKDELAYKLSHQQQSQPLYATLILKKPGKIIARSGKKKTSLNKIQISPNSQVSPQTLSKDAFLVNAELQVERETDKKSEEEQKSIKTNEEELGSNEQFDQYMSEIQDGLKIFASLETISSEDKEEKSLRPSHTYSLSQDRFAEPIQKLTQNSGSNPNIYLQTKITDQNCQDDEEIFETQNDHGQLRVNYFKRLLDQQRQQYDQNLRFSDNLSQPQTNNLNFKKLRFHEETVESKEFELKNPTYRQTQSLGTFGQVDEGIISHGTKALNDSSTKGVTKIIKILAAGQAENLRDRLECFGKLQFLENHFIEKEDVIAKFHKIEDSKEAFQELSKEFTVIYVPTKHNSDDVNNFKCLRTETYDHDARDATITLNMFKIKDTNIDQFFTKEHDEVENLFAQDPFPQRDQQLIRFAKSMVSIDSDQGNDLALQQEIAPLRKSMEPQVGPNQIFQQNNGHFAQGRHCKSMDSQREIYVEDYDCVQQDFNYAQVFSASGQAIDQMNYSQGFQRPKNPFILHQDQQEDFNINHNSQQSPSHAQAMHWNGSQISNAPYNQNYVQQQQNLASVNSCSTISQGYNTQMPAQQMPSNMLSEAQEHLVEDHKEPFEMAHHSESRQQQKPQQEPQQKGTKQNFNQFGLDITKIVSGQDQRTTIMIKNIPNKYTQAMLLQTLDRKQKNQYDFFYLPIDYRNKCNMGYAFINFIDAIFIVEFFQQFDGKGWECFNSDKICQITYGKIQGKQALEKNFSNMSTHSERGAKVRPLIFYPQQPSLETIQQLRQRLQNQFQVKTRSFNNEWDNVNDQYEETAQHKYEHKQSARYSQRYSQNSNNKQYKAKNLGNNRYSNSKSYKQNSSNDWANDSVGYDSNHNNNPRNEGHSDTSYNYDYKPQYNYRDVGNRNYLSARENRYSHDYCDYNDYKQPHDPYFTKKGNQRDSRDGNLNSYTKSRNGYSKDEGKINGFSSFQGYQGFARTSGKRNLNNYY